MVFMHVLSHSQSKNSSTGAHGACFNEDQNDWTGHVKWVSKFDMTNFIVFTVAWISIHIVFYHQFKQDKAAAYKKEWFQVRDKCFQKSEHLSKHKFPGDKTDKSNESKSKEKSKMDKPAIAPKALSTQHNSAAVV
jgi:hypothetical protein